MVAVVERGGKQEARWLSVRFGEDGRWMLKAIEALKLILRQMSDLFGHEDENQGR
jgi:hypothetical protein